MLTVDSDIVPDAFAKHRNLLLFIREGYHKLSARARIRHDDNEPEYSPKRVEQSSGRPEKYIRCQSKLFDTTAS